jgi:hypothetical protein
MHRKVGDKACCPYRLVTASFAHENNAHEEDFLHNYT